MGALLVVSLLWAFSFGLIRRYLVTLDSSAVALLRLILSLLVFLPWLGSSGLSGRFRLRLMGIGAIQFGLMYLLYLAAFRSLLAHQVALLTLTTPVFVSLFDGLLSRRFSWQAWAAALLAVLGAVVVMGPRALGHTEWWGLVLIQASNACFALGQLLYRRSRQQRKGPSEPSMMAWLSLGAVLVAFPYAGSALPGTVASLSLLQAVIIVYLGVLASGLGFLLFNYGATRVNVGVLAVMNNLKIPLGVLVSLLVFGEKASWGRLATGCVVILLGLALAQSAESKPQGRRSE
jgi:drug/metabolite transporter (DMT)-like permease